MLFVVSAVLFDMLKARQLACVSKSGQKCPAALSLSSWRAWIEILVGPGCRGCRRSLSSWRAWIEMLMKQLQGMGNRSLSSWRAWIEIWSVGHPADQDGSLSSWRAWIEIRESTKPRARPACRSPHGERGLKCGTSWSPLRIARSLSSWRAWIEIWNGLRTWSKVIRSLSSWRAWIEIPMKQWRKDHDVVALLMESVD